MWDAQHSGWFLSWRNMIVNLKLYLKKKVSLQGALRRMRPGEMVAGEKYHPWLSKVLHSCGRKIQSLQKCTQPSGLKDCCVASAARISGNLLADLPSRCSPPMALARALLKDNTILLNALLKNEPWSGEWEWFTQLTFLCLEETVWKLQIALLSAGMELISFPVAGVVLCLGFRMSMSGGTANLSQRWGSRCLTVPLSA